jgi:hypothetical protein
MGRVFRKYGFYMLLVGYAVFVTYGWIDRALACDDARQQQISDKKDAELLRVLLLGASVRWDRADFTKLVEHNFGKSPFGPDHIVREGRDEIGLDGIIIRFHGQSISVVQFLNE